MLGYKTVVSLLVHCTWGDWFPWTECSTTCGLGVRSRKRLIGAFGNAAGEKCHKNGLEESVKCNEATCVKKGISPLARYVAPKS